MMLAGLVRVFILWARRRAPYRQRVVTFDDVFLFSRFEFAWRDEWPDSWYDRHKAYRAEQGDAKLPKRPHRPPWWRPFNLMLHCWDMRSGSREGFHDHPRWSVTICLRGQIIEHTPWSSRLLKPGSVVIRSRKAIHAFEVPPGHNGKTWTLFIVGRRNHRQNTYVVNPR